jgi:hypothetical protein
MALPAPEVFFPRGRYKHLVDQVINTNLSGTFRCTQRAARLMARAGGGSIVNITSQAGVFYSRGQGCHYAASKAAIIQLTRVLSFELGPLGIRINSIAPGSLSVERNRERAARLKDELQAMRRLPVRRVEAFRDESVTVSRWSTVQVAHNVYSVPSRLIGYRLRARVHAATIELEYGGRSSSGWSVCAEITTVVSFIRSCASPAPLSATGDHEALFPPWCFARLMTVWRKALRSGRISSTYGFCIWPLPRLSRGCEQALTKLLAQGELPEYEAVKSLVKLVKQPLRAQP